MSTHEVNFDGIVGPTHNYAGLSFGNVASMRHKLTVSNPKKAALEGLAKMQFLADLGIKQAVLPPHARPDLGLLRRLGFSGNDFAIIQKAHKADPALLAAAYSASSMWAANAATVSPSADCADGRVHFTPANLISNLHRSIETPVTTRILRAIFADESRFVVHDPLPATPQLGDEGAANHTRLFGAPDQPGLEIFAFGRSAFDPSLAQPSKFPARQTLEASMAIARLHQLDPARIVFIQQNPAAIDAGAFHNDVVAVGHRNVLLYHERAYVNLDLPGDWQLIQVPENRVSLKEAISTYLFNGQLVTLPEGSLSLIAPVECRESQTVHGFIQELLSRADTPIRSVHFVDVRQSMANGGGPACLRLRVVLTDEELARVSPGVIWSDSLRSRLNDWIDKHYRDQLAPDDLRDPKLLDESRRALDELAGILMLK
jgi:succinylarginine dihydrolase